MRILFLCHRFPYPPNSGANIRSFNMIRHLSRDHAVVVASLTRNETERQAIPDLERQCAGVVTAPIGNAGAWAKALLALPTPSPSSFGYFSSPALMRRLRRLLREQSFDLVIAHSSSVGPYAAAAQGIPKIIDFCDMDSRKWLTYREQKPFPISLGYGLEGIKLTRVERRLATDFDCATCATPAELESLREIAPGATGDWFPNGVDLEFFQPDEGGYDPDQICFVGRMDYFPNAQAMAAFVREVMPLIRAERPGSKLVIVGAAPSAEVRALAEAEGVTVTGSVPDVRPFFAASACSVAPLIVARGTQNKILESLAMGVPVVASGLAARGLDAVPGEHLLAADGPAATAAAVLGLMADPGERQRLALAGRARVESHHSWAGAMAKLDRIIVQTMNASAARREVKATPGQLGAGAG
ncbi:MAG: TIGR03087 family PEP-CTERM/XrtA system glycosyltransferase [Kiloniellaceae bacterium]